MCTCTIQQFVTYNSMYMWTEHVWSSTTGVVCLSSGPGSLVNILVYQWEITILFWIYFLYFKRLVLFVNTPPPTHCQSLFPMKSYIVKVSPHESLKLWCSSSNKLQMYIFNAIIIGAIDKTVNLWTFCIWIGHNTCSNHSASIHGIFYKYNLNGNQ